MTAVQSVFLALTPEERARRFELEEQIEVGLRAGAMAGRALAEIRDERLYRSTHATFEEYGQTTFGVRRQRLYQLIDFATVADECAAQGFELDNERIARALKVAPPGDYRVVMDVAREVTGKAQPTAADVKGVAETFRNLHHGDSVEHPDTGEQVPFDSLPPEKKAETVVRSTRQASQDVTRFQGVEEERPLDWLAGFQHMGIEGGARFSAAGWWVELADPETGELRSGPVRKNIWEAIRAARAVWERA